MLRLAVLSVIATLAFLAMPSDAAVSSAVTEQVSRTSSDGSVSPEPEPVSPGVGVADDDYLVALARDHGADWIVTGDKDLLEWEDQRPPAFTPAAFKKLLGSPGA